jgi:hypothetical protein
MSISAIIKGLLYRLPAPLDLWSTELARAALPRTWPQRRRTRRILRKIGEPVEVVSGMFRGMRYPLRVGGQGGLLPKLLGTYEKELLPALAKIIAGQPERVIDIGAAEGYYAIGLARQLPAVRVVCFEMETPYHGLIARLARENGVRQRVTILGLCTVGELRRIFSEDAASTLLLCDCEGAEGDLLDPNQVPQLRAATIVCEMHDLLRPGVSALIRERFASSHDIEVVKSAPRTVSDVPGDVSLSADDIGLALSEGRAQQMDWLVMHPRRSTGPLHRGA